MTIDDEVRAFLVAADDGPNETVAEIGGLLALVSWLVVLQLPVCEVIDHLTSLLVQSLVFALVLVDGILDPCEVALNYLGIAVDVSNLSKRLSVLLAHAGCTSPVSTL